LCEAMAILDILEAGSHWFHSSQKLASKIQSQAALRASRNILSKILKPLAHTPSDY
jgi:hypothetical protein